MTVLQTEAARSRAALALGAGHRTLRKPLPRRDLGLGFSNLGVSMPAGL